ncbi:MAG: glyoxylate/hydroxypyruvate reductase A [Rhodospirillales bacterium]|nr:glyoxylate/hydroxypyruvate reductase A [Rhodospirillales bacterium]
MAVLFSSEADDPTAWVEALTCRLPGIEMRIWPEVGDVRDIEVALVWRCPPGDLRRYPNLRLICSLGAGVEHVLADSDLPPGVPVTKIVDPDLTAGMSEYVLAAALHYHRQFPIYAAFQRDGRWKKLRRPDTARRRIGLLGLGELGCDAGAKFVALGFPVAGWSRTPKSVPGIESFAGADGLHPFLARTDILICLLPLTAATRGIVNRETLAALPKGAYVINATAVAASRRHAGGILSAPVSGRDLD